MSTQTLEAPAAAPTGRPRASALLRAGAQVHPQGRGALYRYGRTCALGALAVGALLARGVAHDDLADILFFFGYMRSLIEEETGVDTDMMLRRPDDGMPTTLAMALIHLNDTVSWTREEVADWLEAIGL